MTIDAKIMGSIGEAFDLLPSAMNTQEAWVMQLVIGLQESRFKHRRQIIKRKDGELSPTGPAVSFWQMERGGGVRGVINHDASRYWANRVCIIRGVAFNSQAVWDRMQQDDVLGAAFSRLLLFTDPWKLPRVDDVTEAWDLYMRVWRPGKPHRATWDEFHAQAREIAASVSWAPNKRPGSPS